MKNSCECGILKITLGCHSEDYLSAFLSGFLKTRFHVYDLWQPWLIKSVFERHLQILNWYVLA